jgi:hypothetical protein
MICNGEEVKVIAVGPGVKSKLYFDRAVIVVVVVVVVVMVCTMGCGGDNDGAHAIEDNFSTTPAAMMIVKTWTVGRR